MAQAAKQEEFTRFRADDHVDAPRVLRSGRLTAAARWSFDMQYCRRDNAVDFLQTASMRQVDELVSRLIQVIEESVAGSVTGVVSNTVMRQKCDAVAERCAHPVVSAAAAYVGRMLPDELCLPIGPCHGDMSLSNVLVGRDCNVTLIDFLDVFLDTPLQDVVKLRQDTCHHWAFVMYKSSFDVHRLRMLLGVMDAVIDAHMRRHPWYVELYHLFQVLNFMRIMQYCHDARRVGWAVKTLEQLMAGSHPRG